jgi:hypothetical protein
MSSTVETIDEGRFIYHPESGNRVLKFEHAVGRRQTFSKAKEARGISATPFVLRNPALIPQRDWLYGRHLARKFLSTTVAPGGVGKSSLVITEALAMASGQKLLGQWCAPGLRVWLWNGEDPVDEMERRIAATALHYDIEGGDIAGRLFVDSGREMEIVLATQTREGTVIAEPVVSSMIETIRKHRIDVIVIDPFVSSHRVTENDNNAIDRVAKTWGRIADDTNCAVQLVHHVRKTNGAEISVEDGRGAVALLAAARSARVLNVMSEEEATKANVENRRLYFRVTDGKGNMSPPAEKSDWHKMESVDLGNGHLGMGGDSIGVVTTWEWPNALDGIEVADLLKAQKAIDGCQWRENDQAGDWVGKPVARALDLDIGSGRTSELTKPQKAAKAKVKTLIRVWIGSGALVLVEGKDGKSNIRKFVEVGEWAGTDTFR